MSTEPSPELLAALAVFDDATLETLASKGLLRRARRDVDAGKAALESADGEPARVSVDGETVTLGPDGPTGAACSCPAQGVCRHRLAAVLLLRDHRPAAASPSGQAAPSPTTDRPADPPADPLAELVDLGVAGIERWAGKAATRAAHELLSSASSPAIERDGAALVVTLSDDTPAVRYLSGQGADGMVSKAATARRKALHAAAALAVLHQHAPAQFDAAPTQQAETPIEPPNPAFLNQVSTALNDCTRSGLSLAPQVLEERLFALSVSSRADALPRLSKRLRALAAALDDKRSAAPRFDPRAFLRLAADAAALTAATAALTPSDRERARALLGEVRQAYHPLDDLELYGCGSQLWRTQAGARGVTAWFYAPALDRWFSAGIARAAGQDGAFDPRAAWFRDALWGAGPLAAIGHCRLRLANPAASNDGRLSTARTVRGHSQAWSPGQHDTDWTSVFDDWQALQEQLSEHYRPGLHARTGPRPVLLRPAESARAWFDELEQRVVWPLADRNGAWIGLALDYAGNEHGVAEIERVSAKRIDRVCALALPTAAGLRLTPMSYLPHAKDSTMRSIGLDPDLSRFHQQPNQAGLLRRARDRASALLLRGPSFRTAGVDTTTRTLVDDALDALQMWAEVGDAALPRIAAAARTLDDAGFTLPAAALQDIITVATAERPERVLAAVYLLGLATGMERRLEWLEQQ